MDGLSSSIDETGPAGVVC